MCRRHFRQRLLYRQAGFTLIELVIVIVLLGIIAVASTQFIGQGISIYRNSVARDNLQQQGRFAIERISRELRNALPGSVRTFSNATTQCVEFIPIIAASTYLQPVADAPVTSLDVVDFAYSYRSGDLIAVYPIDETAVYSAPSAVASVIAATAPASDQQTLTLTPYQFPNESPTGRFFIIRNEPISFCAQDNALTRQDNYSRSLSPSVPPGDSTLLAENIRLVDGATNVTVFDFTAGTPQRSAVVHMDLRFSNAAGDEWVKFSQEVFIRNTP